MVGYAEGTNAALLIRNCNDLSIVYMCNIVEELKVIVSRSSVSRANPPQGRSHLSVVMAAGRRKQVLLSQRMMMI